MRLLVVLCSASALAAAAALTAPAFAAEQDDGSRRSIGNYRTDSSSRRTIGNLRPDSATGGSAAQGSDQAGANPTVVVPPSYRHGHRHPRYYHGYPSRYYRDRPYYGNPYNYRRYYAYPPPVFVPFGSLYGPGAVMRFMGM
jgi:hypothetical protein